MKSPTLGPSSARIQFAVCGLLLCATPLACQSNTTATPPEATSTPLTTAPALVATSAAEGTSPASTSNAASEAARPAEVTSSAAAVAAKTPRPKVENDVEAKPENKPETKPASAATSVAAPEPPKEEPVGEVPAIEKPCLAKSFEFASVKAACEKGGVPKAKALMKGWTKKAKDKGEEYKCTTCHDNQRTYSNKPNADADLRKLLNVIK